MVAATAIDRPLTDKDLESLPDDGNRYELIWGELYVSPAPSIRHQIVSANLQTTLNDYLLQRGRGLALSAPVGGHLDSSNVVQPDLVVFENYNDEVVRQQEFTAPPDLAIEILSPSNRAQDIVKKQVLYAHFNVPEYWIVDPEKETISVLVLDGELYAAQDAEDGVARSVRFPGLEVDPKGIAEPPVRRSK